MSVFDQAVAFVLAQEGGYSFNPADPGGETNFGICKRDYPSLAIGALTKDQAVALYRRDYWDKIHGDDLPADIAFYLFDTAVNIGVRAAVRLLQRAERVTEDGVIGPVTIAAALSTGLLDGLDDDRQAYYRALSGFPTFGRGWIARSGRAYHAASAMKNE